MQRLPVLLVVLVLGLVPTVIQAGSRQGNPDCNASNTFEGEFLDASYTTTPDADAVVVRYRFTFPQDVYLPMRFYSATMFVQVESGQFSLELAEDQSVDEPEGTPVPRWGRAGQTTVVRVNPEPGSADDALVAAGETIEALVEGDKVFHDGGVYRYVNTSESSEDSTLLVTVIVPRADYVQALKLGEEDGNDEEKPRHAYICPWCEVFAQFDQLAQAHPSLASAGLLPAIQCGGG